MIAIFALVVSAFAQTPPTAPVVAPAVPAPTPVFETNVQPKDPVAAVRKTADDARAKIKALTGRVIALESVKGLTADDRKAIDDLRARVEQIEKKIDGIESGKPFDPSALEARIKALETDTDEVEDSVEARVAKLEEREVWFGPTFTIDSMLAPPVPGIADPLGFAVGGGFDVGAEDGLHGFELSYSALLTDGDGYSHALSYSRFKKRGAFAWGLSTGMSATFYDARDGIVFSPEYGAWRAGVDGGLYFRSTLYEGKSAASELTIRPRIEFGTVATAKESASEARAGISFTLTRKYRIGGKKIADPVLQEEFDALDDKVEALGKKHSESDDSDDEDDDLDLDEEP